MIIKTNRWEAKCKEQPAPEAKNKIQEDHMFPKIKPKKTTSSEKEQKTNKTQETTFSQETETAGDPFPCEYRTISNFKNLPLHSIQGESTPAANIERKNAKC